jgi:HTH-type transcriptional regulator/antitoxin HipB
VDSQEIAKIVRVRRKHLRVTQAELADIAGVSPRFIYDLEKGKPTVALDKTLHALEALGLRVSVAVAS